MNTAWFHMLARLILTTPLLLPGTTGALEDASYETLRDRFDELRNERRSAADDMRELKDEYREVVASIDRLKTGEDGAMTGRQQLDTLMRRSRRIAGRLEKKQATIGDLDRQLDRLRGALTGHLADEITRLEQTLTEVDADRRAELVDRLNRLRRQQRDFQTPLPDVPRHRDIAETLERAERVDAGPPGRRRAAADELRDTEQQLRRRLEAVQRRLESLERRRQLARRTGTFRRREAFFDERARAAESTGGNGASDASSSETEAAPPSSRNGESPPSNAAGGAPKGAGDPPDDGSRSFDDGAADPVEPGPPNDGPPSGATATGGPGDSPFAAEETLLLDGPGDGSDDLAGPEHELDEEIERLEEEREELEAQVQRLEERAESIDPEG